MSLFNNSERRHCPEITDGDRRLNTPAELMNDLRQKLVATALAWEHAFGNAPSITSAISEFDAATLVGMSVEEYSASMQRMSSVKKGYDFKFNGARYQVKGNRPSGKPGSFVTLVPKAGNYDWDFLVWILYNPYYEIQEAWLWEVSAYKASFDSIKRLSPSHYRQGKALTVIMTPSENDHPS